MTAHKLRKSCDQCASCKIKCGREEPVCVRCDRKGIPCYYSPSRRHGRPSAKNKPPTSSNEPPTREPRLLESSQTLNEPYNLVATTLPTDTFMFAQAQELTRHNGNMEHMAFPPLLNYEKSLERGQGSVRSRIEEANISGTLGVPPDHSQPTYTSMPTCASKLEHLSIAASPATGNLFCDQGATFHDVCPASSIPFDFETSSSSIRRETIEPKLPSPSDDDVLAAMSNLVVKLLDIFSDCRKSGSRSNQSGQDRNAQHCQFCGRSG